MKLALGTAQMGLEYGTFNSTGRIGIDQVWEIFKLAHSRGISTIDTATAYGTSEQVLGHYSQELKSWDIITKVPPIKTISQELNPIHQSVELSLSSLKQNSLYGVLMHSAQDLLGDEGARYWNSLIKQKERGRIKKIGVSIYTVAEGEELLKRYPIEIIQLPMSILDRRPMKSGFLEKAKTKNVEIHVRSIFLQGLLLTQPEVLNSFFKPLQSHLIRMVKQLKEQNITALDACIGFVKQIPEVDKIVIGIDGIKHLAEIINAYEKNMFSDDKNFEWTGEEIFLNPGQWKLSKV